MKNGTREERAFDNQLFEDKHKHSMVFFSLVFRVTFTFSLFVCDYFCPIVFVFFVSFVRSPRSFAFCLSVLAIDRHD